MPTNARYMSIIGGNRIVSLINADGLGVAVPKTLENEIYGPLVPGEEQFGNRKIAIKMKIQPAWDPEDPAPPVHVEDQLFRLKVQVPAGVIAAPGVQRFTASTPLLSYFPRAWVDAQNRSCFFEEVFATPIIGSQNPANQTLDVLIQTRQTIDEGDRDNELIFLVTVDWSHSVVN